MTISPGHDPRANQKQRTRSAIVEAAIKLLGTGVRPTVPEAAAAAKVSRATAYRYFPTQDALLVEAAAHGPADAVEALLDRAPGDDARAHLLKLQAGFLDMAIAEEAAMRAALRAYLDAWFTAREKGETARDIREGRRMRWIATALAPELAALPAEQAQRLHAALALTMGIEPLVVMKDVCRADDDEARATLAWAAEALLAAALNAGE
ncbi:MAG: TetR family transcriptional regulator [Sphingopyxis sp.]|nr:TetR family transcriptional regulator [Sphingopyxis sp.]